MSEVKTVLITGGTSRVGQAVAIRLAGEGMNIVLTYHRQAQEADQLVTGIQRGGRQALAIQANLLDPQSVRLIHQQVIEKFGQLDVLVNNASRFTPTAMGSMTGDDFNREMAVNVLAPTLLTQVFAESLSRRYDPRDPTSVGRIVNLIDMHVMGQPLRGYLAYSASKAALMEVTHCCALELAPKVTVNAIAPGVVAWASSYTAAQREQYMKRVPLARTGTPDDAAAAVAYLVGEGHYCTGQIIRLDGGRLLT